jgi:predicted nucleic acid-binding Zn ribbon protein
LTRIQTVNRIGRRTILAMLLIVALVILWNVLGPR